ncbi:Protein of unknown function (DUF3632) domain containing protein [Rhypophila sp. PSN 637]
MSSEYAVWFTAHKDDLSLGAISDEAFSVFDQFLGSEITATATTSQLVRGRTAADEDKIRRHVFSLIVAVAQFFPDAHPQLIELSTGIFSDSTVDRQPFGWDLRGTHDALQAQITETIKSAPSAKGASSESFSSLQRRWANFHAFNAKCSAAGTVHVGENFMILAAEKSLEATAPGPLQLQFYAPAAAAWLAYAAPAVLALCRTNASSGWHEAAAADKLWKGKEGFSDGRWEFWKTRLEELRTQGGIDDGETVSLIRQAFVAMDKAERAKKGKK